MAIVRPLKKRAMSWSEDCHGSPRALITVSLSTSSFLLLNMGVIKMTFWCHQETVKLMMRVRETMQQLQQTQVVLGQLRWQKQATMTETGVWLTVSGHRQSESRGLALARSSCRNKQLTWCLPGLFFYCYIRVSEVFVSAVVRTNSKKDPPNHRRTLTMYQNQTCTSPFQHSRTYVLKEKNRIKMLQIKTVTIFSRS